MINYSVAYLCTLIKVPDNNASVKVTGNDRLKMHICKIHPFKIIDYWLKSI